MTDRSKLQSIIEKAQAVLDMTADEDEETSSELLDPNAAIDLVSIRDSLIGIRVALEKISAWKP